LKLNISRVEGVAKKMSEAHEHQRKNDAGTVLHWYDFICPFCYVGQQRTAILVRHGLDVIELPFQIHPDIPPGGIPAGPRTGPMYTMLEREAKEAGLPLNWPPRLPDTRLALAAAEWARRHQPRAFPQFHKDLFEAHFVLGEDLEDAAVIDRHATGSGIDLAPLHAALADGSAAAAVREDEMMGRKNGVKGTPAWLLGEQLIIGLRPAAEFERLAENAMQSPR
jgi:predicted DsbA family dithiol-disulfide isomerase